MTAADIRTQNLRRDFIMGDQVVHDQDALARLHVRLVHLDLGLAVLECVLARVCLSGQLALLPDQDQRDAHPLGEGRGKDETAGLDRRDRVDALFSV